GMCCLTDVGKSSKLRAVFTASLPRPVNWESRSFRLFCQPAHISVRAARRRSSSATRSSEEPSESSPRAAGLLRLLSGLFLLICAPVRCGEGDGVGREIGTRGKFETAVCGRVGTGETDRPFRAATRTVMLKSFTFVFALPSL